MFLCICVLSHSVVSNSLQPHGLYPAKLLCPWDSPGKNTVVGCHALLQGIFPTQGLNSGLWHRRQILYQGRMEGNSGMEVPELAFTPQNKPFLDTTIPPAPSPYFCTH